MSIILYEYIELDERIPTHLRKWKALHVTIFILVAIFGILNYIFFIQTKEVVNDNCVLYPRQLEFEWVEVPDLNDARRTDFKQAPHNPIDKNNPEEQKSIVDNEGLKVTENTTSAIHDNETKHEQAENIKIIVPQNRIKEFEETIIEYHDFIVITGNSTRLLMLDMDRTLFYDEADCEFAEYMPLVSNVFAIFWVTMFLYCPSGGKSKGSHKLHKSWRILTPALVFSLLMVVVLGYCFTITDKGLQAFCQAFYNVTNDTTCTPVNRLLPLTRRSTWGLEERVSLTRAASAGVWACWLLACALLIARCLVAPDFIVRRTKVCLKDPTKKLIRSRGQLQQSVPSSPNKKLTDPVKSESTFTEQVTVSVEQEPDLKPFSLLSTPVKQDRKGEVIEMTSNR